MYCVRESRFIGVDVAAAGDVQANEGLYATGADVGVGVGITVGLGVTVGLGEPVGLGMGEIVGTGGTTVGVGGTGVAVGATRAFKIQSRRVTYSLCDQAIPPDGIFEAGPPEPMARANAGELTSPLRNHIEEKN